MLEGSSGKFVLSEFSWVGSWDRRVVTEVDTRTPKCMTLSAIEYGYPRISKRWSVILCDAFLGVSGGPWGAMAL